ncbi:hypothetical protein [Paradevosia shaoguanensis]|uniref:Uncharacterized protein n=1 Tax=Paradevosia shaoguanensis TaxID=1335043 RepID=A0AA41QSH6_9HYPH|nr:hypothetical protein [Paradevosia shaoguanensis]MCF1744706.1 hypothetical protein [Paradevosia shaoguanensis]MCI0129189.1 hypothetical protein [Paradevosia shaoguanensis]
MKDDARSVKFQLMVSPSELAAIDEYRWSHRLPSRAEAVRHLVRAGMFQKAKGPASAPTLPSHDQTHNPSKNGGIDA